MPKKTKKPRIRRTWSISPATKVKSSGKIYKRGSKTQISGESSSLEAEFVYCPQCAGHLTLKIIEDKKRQICPVCGYVNYQNPIPACAVILEKEGKILLVKRKYLPAAGDFSLPSGFMEREESPEKTAVREVKEETGLDIRLKHLLNVYKAADDPRAKVVLIVYTGEIIGGELKAGDDASEVGFYPQSSIPSNLAFRSHRKALQDYFELKRKS